MTVKFYITQDRHTGRETSFEKPHEREAAIIIARAFWEAYRHSDKTYAIVANPMRPNRPDDPWMDLVVLTEEGIGVVELKYVSGPLEGTHNTPWTSLDTGYTILVGGLNPPYYATRRRLRGWKRRHIT